MHALAPRPACLPPLPCTLTASSRTPRLPRYDVERFVYEVLRGFRCAPWFHSYLVARHRMGERLGGGQRLEAALDGFHPLPDYFTARAFFRWAGPVGACGGRGRHDEVLPLW